MPVLSTLRDTWNDLSTIQKVAVGVTTFAAATSGGYYLYKKRNNNNNNNTNETTLSMNNTTTPSVSSPTIPLNNNTNQHYSPSFDEGVDGRYVSTLSEKELSTWLAARGLPKADVEALCNQHHVDGAVFVRLTPDLVEEMHLPSVGGRVRLAQLVVRCRDSISMPPTPRRAAPAAAENNTNNNNGSPLPPWRAATQSNEGSIQRQQVQKQAQNLPTADEKDHVLNRLITTFKTLSNAEFIRYSPDVQRNKIADAEDLLGETEEYLQSLPAEKAAPFTEVVGRFRLLIDLLKKQLDALEGGAHSNNQQHQQDQSGANSTNVEIIKQNYERLARAATFIQSAHFVQGIAEGDKATVLDQAAKMYEEVVSRISSDDVSQALQREIVPELLKIQKILTAAAGQLGNNNDNSSTQQQQQQQGTTANSVMWQNDRNNNNNNNKASSQHQQQQPPTLQAPDQEGGLHDLFNFFSTDEFINLSTEEKRRALGEAERRLAMMIQASMSLPAHERARVGPAIERLSEFLGKLKSYHLTQAQRKFQQAQEDAKKEIQRKLGGRFEEDENNQNDDDDDDEYDQSANPDAGTPSSSYANVRASLILLRDMVKVLGSEEFLGMEEDEQIERIAVAEDTHSKICDVLDSYSEKDRKPFLPIVNQLGQLVGIIREKVLNASPATRRARRVDNNNNNDINNSQPVSDAAIARAAQRQGVQAPSRHVSPPFDNNNKNKDLVDSDEEDANEQMKLMMEKQVDQARQRERDVSNKQSEETQLELKRLFEVFRFMSSEPFDALSHERKVDILRTAKVLLEEQLERVENEADEGERTQLAPILERMVDILANVNQLVTEQQQKENQQQPPSSADIIAAAQKKVQEKQQQQQPLFLQVLRQLSNVFSILSAANFNDRPLEQQREVTKEAQRLVTMGTQLLESEATDEEREQYGPVLSRMAEALGLAGGNNKSKNNNNKDEDDDEEEDEIRREQEQMIADGEGEGDDDVGQLAKSVEQLLTVFKMIVGEDFSQLPDEKKMQILQLARQLMDHNIRLFNSDPEMKMVTEGEKRRYGPILQQVADSFKKLGLLEDSNIQQQQQGNQEEEEQQEDAADQANNDNSNKRTISLKEPMSRLVQVFQLVTSDEFQKVSEEQQAQVISLVKSLADVNTKAMQHATAADKKTFAPILEKIINVLERLGLLDESQQEQQEQQVQKQQQAPAPTATSSSSAAPVIALKEPMSKLVQVFQMIVGDDFSQLPDDKKMQIITLVKNLAEVNKQAFPHASAEEKKTFGPVFQKVLDALKQLKLIDSADFEQEQQQAPAPAPAASSAAPVIALKEPMSKLVQVFQMIVGDDFGQLPDDKKMQIITLVKNLADVNKKAFPHASAEEKQIYGPIFQKVLDALKQLKLIDNADFEQEQPKQQQQQDSGAADEEENNNKGNTISMKQPMSRLVQVFQLITSEDFQKVTEEQQAQVISLVKNLADVNTKAMQHATAADKKTFAPILEKIITVLQKLGLVDQQQGAVATAAEDQEQKQESSSSSMAVPMTRLLDVFKIIVSDKFTDAPDQDKLTILADAKHLAETNVQLLGKAPKMERERFGPVLEQIIGSLKKLGIFKQGAVAQQEEEEESQQQEEEKISMAEPLMKLAQTFQMLVSENFQTLSDEEKNKVMNLTRRLALTNIKLMPQASAQDQQKFGPVLEKLVESLKKIGLLEESEIAEVTNNTNNNNNNGSSSGAPSQQKQQQPPVAPPQQKEATASSSSEELSIRDPVMRIVQMFQIIVSENFSKLPTEQQLQVMKTSKDLTETVVQIWPQAPAEEKKQLRTIFEKSLGAMKKLSIVAPTLELPVDDVSSTSTSKQQQQQQHSCAEENQKEEQQQQNQQKISLEKPMKQLINTFQIIVSDSFSQLPEEKKVEVMSLCQQLAAINMKLIASDNASAEDKKTYGPILDQVVSALRKIGLLEEDGTTTATKKTSSSSTSTSTATGTTEEESSTEAAALDEQKRQLQEQIEQRRSASEDFEALSSLFNSISQDPTGFQNQPSAERRGVLVKGLTLIERCARHLQAVPAEERDSLVPVLSQMQQFFKEMATEETKATNLEVNAAEKKWQERNVNISNENDEDVPPKYRDDESGYENDEDEEEEEDEELKEQRQDPSSVKSLNQLITVMQHLTNPSFADLPSQHRKQLLQQGKLALMDVHKTISAETFPEDSRGRIAPLVQKFATLIQAVAQAEEGVAESEDEITTINKSQQQQQQESESSSSTAADVPSGSVERLMELYKMIVSPKFQQMPADVQTNALRSTRELANLVKKGSQNEENPVLKSKIENFLNRVDEVVNALEQNLANKKKNGGSAAATAVSASQQQQQQQENDEEDEEEDEEEALDAGEEAVEGEAELATQLDALLDIIRSKDTMSAIHEGGARRARVLQVINDVVGDCQSQIDRIGDRGQLYQDVLDKIKEAKTNIEGTAAIHEAAGDSSSSRSASQQQQQQQKSASSQNASPDTLRQRDNMLRAREVSRNLGVILEALNSDKLLSLPDEERQELLGQIGNSIQVLKDQTEMLDDAEKQALLPTLAQVESFVQNIASVKTDGAVSQVLSERIAAEQQQQDDEEEDDDETENDNNSNDDSSSGASDDPPPQLSGDDQIRSKILGQLQRIDDVISSENFAKAPIEVRRQTARAVFAQIAELRKAAERLLNEDDLESFENDTADLVSRLQELTNPSSASASAPSSQQGSRQASRQATATATSTNNNGNNNNDDDDENNNNDDDDENNKNAGREAGRPAPDQTSEIAIRIMKKAQQFFEILNSPAFISATDEAKAKIATEILQQAQTMLTLTHKQLSESEQGEISPILVGIIRMCRALADPEGEERDEEGTSDDDEQQQQKDDDRSKPLRSPSGAAAAGSPKPASSSRQQSQQQQQQKSASPANASNKSSSASPRPAQPQQQANKSNDDEQQQQQTTEKTTQRSELENDRMTELLSIAKALQTPNLTLPEEEIANIAERVEEILRTDLQHWRAVPELKSLVRFITAQLSRLTEEREASVQRHREESAQRRQNNNNNDNEDTESEPYSESDEQQQTQQQQQQQQQKSSSPAAPSSKQASPPQQQKSALEQRLYNLLQSLITNADTMTKEADIAPFVSAIESLTPSAQNFTEREGRLFNALREQVALIQKKGISHVEEVNDDDDNDSTADEATNSNTNNNNKQAQQQQNTTTNNGNINNNKNQQQQQNAGGGGGKKKKGGGRRR